MKKVKGKVVVVGEKFIYIHLSQIYQVIKRLGKQHFFKCMSQMDKILPKIILWFQIF